MAEQNQFCVFVRYDPIPSLQELQQQFDWVNGTFAWAKFAAVDQCKDVSRNSRELTLEYLRPDHRATIEEILERMDKSGFRPAFLEELLAFATKFPDEQRKFPIVALGSVNLIQGRSHVAKLDANPEQRELFMKWTVEIGNHEGWRFLVARK